MEEKSELPSLPSNYVTLLQLQERWIKEQQRKQKEKEKEEEEKRELEKLKEEKGKEKTDSNPRFRTGYRNAKVINSRIVEAVRPESVEVEAVEEKTGGGEVELKKKKKRYRKKRNKNKKEGDVAGESENHAPEGRSEKENVPARSGGERKGRRIEIRPRSENLKVAAERRRGEKEDVPAISGGERSKNSVVVVDQTVEIELKLGNLSVKDGIVNGGSVRRNVINRGDERFERWANSRGQRRFDRRENWGEMVWVRKGEVSDGNGGGIPSSLD